jgi:uncharacterized phage protein gp47/JayE
VSQPLPPTSPVLAIPTSIDYTSRDYQGAAASMLTFAQQIMPDWNTSSEGDMGVMLLELFAYVTDILSLYTDRVAQEAYLPTATQRLSLLNIADLLGYVPSNGTPSAGTVTFQTVNPGNAVILDVGTQVSTNFSSAIDQPIIFQTTEQITVPANGGTAVAAVQQGNTVSNTSIGISNGLAGQQFTLPDTGVQDGTTQIFVQNSSGGATEWTQVTNFVNSDADDMVFMVTVNANGNTIVTFGDGINGLIPGLGLSIYATYTTIVGTQGNVNAGSVSLMVSSITGVFIPTSTTGLAQSSTMTGGTDAESNDSIRANAPISFATQQRAISLSDYATLCMGVQGVSLANAVANHSTSVNLYFLGPNGTAPSSTLQNSVLEFFTGPPQLTGAGVTLSLPTPNLIPVDIGSSTNNVTLVVLPTYSQQNTLNNVEAALNNLLTPPNVVFGQLLQISSVYQAIMAVAGVEYVIVPVFTREDVVQTGTTSIQFRQSEVPVPGNYYINVSGGV